MKKKLEKLLNYNYIKRTYTTDIYIERILSVWALVSIVILGYFGIRPIIKTNFEKTELIEKMEKVNADLENNFTVLDEIGIDILETSENLPYLYEYMPEKAEVQNYMVDLVSATGSAGFKLTNLSPHQDKTKPGVVVLNYRLKGNGDLIDLVSNIEGIKRTTAIKSIKIKANDEKEDYNISVVSEIFYLE